MSTQKTVRVLRHHHQRGATLFVALIMLLLLTLVGVAGMQNTLQQERMAGSARDHALAVQAAEAALRTAESKLKPPAIAPSTVQAIASTNGLIRKKTDGTAISETAYWQNSDRWKSTEPGVITDTTLATNMGVAESPKYVIEKMPNEYSKIPGSRNADPGSIDPAVKWVRDYRITARAVGGTTDAVVILQSTYRVLE